MELKLTEEDMEAIKQFFNLHPDTRLSVANILKMAANNRDGKFEAFFGRLCLHRIMN